LEGKLLTSGLGDWFSERYFCFIHYLPARSWFTWNFDHNCCHPSWNHYL